MFFFFYTESVTYKQIEDNNDCNWHSMDFGLNSKENERKDEEEQEEEWTWTNWMALYVYYFPTK